MSWWVDESPGFIVDGWLLFTSRSSNSQCIEQNDCPRSFGYEREFKETFRNKAWDGLYSDGNHINSACLVRRVSTLQKAMIYYAITVAKKCICHSKYNWKFIRIDSNTESKLIWRRTCEMYFYTVERFLRFSRSLLGTNTLRKRSGKFAE
jgi:hypothetical protein